MTSAAPIAVLGDLIAETVRAEVRRQVEPLREEIERLRKVSELQVTIREAARRLEVTPRAVQRWLKDGRLEVVQAGGVRMVRWPPRAPPR